MEFQTLSKTFKVKNILTFLITVFVSRGCQNLLLTLFKYVQLTGYSLYRNRDIKLLLFAT